MGKNYGRSLWSAGRGRSGEGRTYLGSLACFVATFIGALCYCVSYSAYITSTTAGTLLLIYECDILFLFMLYIHYNATGLLAVYQAFIFKQYTFSEGHNYDWCIPSPRVTLILVIASAAVTLVEVTATLNDNIAMSFAGVFALIYATILII